MTFYTKQMRTLTCPVFGKEKRRDWFKNLKPVAEQYHRMTCFQCATGGAECKLVPTKSGGAFMLCYPVGTPEFEQFRQEMRDAAMDRWADQIAAEEG